MGSSPGPDDPAGGRGFQVLLLWTMAAVIVNGLLLTLFVPLNNPGFPILSTAVLGVLLGPPWLWYLARRKTRVSRLRAEENAAIIERQLEWARGANAPPVIKK